MNSRSRLKNGYKKLIYRLSADNNFLYLWYIRHSYYPELGSLEHYTSEFSKSNPRLTFIQIGANDGIHNDPIHKFVKRDSWQGLVLEPLPDVFSDCLEPLYRKQDGVIAINAALDVKDGMKPIYRVAISESRWATGLTSFNRSILEAAVSSGYIENQAKKEGISLPQSTDDYIKEEMVECISVTTLLKRHEIGMIDWLQIDTEGFDFEIIKMFDIDKTKPRVIVYENLHLTADAKTECKRHLTTRGYSVKDFGANTLAALNPDEYLAKFLTN